MPRFLHTVSPNSLMRQNVTQMESDIILNRMTNISLDYLVIYDYDILYESVYIPYTLWLRLISGATLDYYSSASDLLP